jgi:hypothetical protein
MLQKRACDHGSSEAANASEEDFHVMMGFLAGRGWERIKNGRDAFWSYRPCSLALKAAKAS